jgi:hypothetical protein
VGFFLLPLACRTQGWSDSWLSGFRAIGGLFVTVGHFGCKPFVLLVFSAFLALQSEKPLLIYATSPQS